MNLVLAHDYLTQLGGAERVVLSMSRTFPGAPIHTSLYDPETTYPEFRQLDVRTLGLDRHAVLRRDHRLAFPLLAPAFSRAAVEADVVVASSSGWAHGLGTTGKVVVYCHAPARWLYQRDRYAPKKASPQWLAAAGLGPILRRWDQRAAGRASRYLVNSTAVRGHVRAAYGIDAEVLHPPITPLPAPARPEGAPDPGYLLVVSRLLPYKNVALSIEAARRRPSDALVVVGDGPQRDELAQGAPANVTFLRDLDDAQMAWAYANARGLLAASHEDFGLTPIEAAAWSTPTVALRAGGYLDTVVDGETGVFFDRLDVASLLAGIERLDADPPTDAALQARAERFSEASFGARLREVVDEVLGA